MMWPLQRTSAPKAIGDTLDELVAEAETYGSLRILGVDRGGYWAKIKFNTLSGTSLEAESAFGVPMKQALREVIANAETIRSQFKGDAK